MVDLGPLDVAGIVLFATFTLLYHGVYHFYTQSRPLATVKGKIALYRRTWIKRIADRGDYILAVQAIRNQIMAASFMASSSLLAIGLLLNFTVGGDPAASLHVNDPHLLVFKLSLLIGVFAFAFLAFMFAIRDLNHLTFLIGADNELIDHVEGIDTITFLSTLLNRAMNRYTYGQRGFYFSLAIIGWIFHPLAFIAASVVIGTLLMFVLDFQRWKLPKVVQRSLEPRLE